MKIMPKSNNLRAFWRVFQFAIVTMILVLSQLFWVVFTDGKTQSPFVRLWCRSTVKITGGNITLSGWEHLAKDRKIYLSNHISYMDIIALGAFFDCFFVAKSDIAHWPVFGFLSRISGTVFVSRKRSDIKKQISALQSSLQSGKQLWIFPEGTTSNGLEILPFKRSLLQAAEETTAQFVIQPVMIAYTHLDGKEIKTNALADLVAWYADMEFMPHLWHFFGLKSWQARIEVLPEDAQLREKGSKKLVSDTEAIVRQSFQIIISAPADIVQE